MITDVKATDSETSRNFLGSNSKPKGSMATTTTTTTTTVTRTRAFFPSLRGLIDSARVHEDDWSLLDEILCEIQDEEPPPIPTEFPTLTSLGIGSGSNRCVGTESKRVCMRVCVNVCMQMSKQVCVCVYLIARLL